MEGETDRRIEREHESIMVSSRLIRVLGRRSVYTVYTCLSRAYASSSYRHHVSGVLIIIFSSQGTRDDCEFLCVIKIPVALIFLTGRNNFS